MDNCDLEDVVCLLKRKNPLYNELLDFYGFILRIQMQTKPRLNGGLGKLNARMGPTYPILERSAFPVDIESAGILFRRMLAAVEFSPPYLKQELNRIESLISSGDMNLEKAFLMHSDEVCLASIAHDYRIDPGVLMFLIRKCVEPSLQLVSEYLRGHASFDEWQEGRCPICGSLPRIGEFSRGEGKRLLQCSFCSFKWRVPRLVCIYCGNTDGKSLKYLYIEADPSRRADVCDRCGQYIKSIDSRNFDYDPLLILEDLITAHLDILAVKEGYSKPCNEQISLP